MKSLAKSYHTTRQHALIEIPTYQARSFSEGFIRHNKQYRFLGETNPKTRFRFVRLEDRAYY